jgi:DNA polymerase III sliding clamp (beta) subunit (PCNA family)
MNTATQSKQDTATVTLDAAQFSAAIKAADLSRGHDKALPMLTVYRIELADNKLQFITTDRYRLSVISLNLDDTAAATLAASGLFNDGGLNIDGDTLTAASKIKTQKGQSLILQLTPQGLDLTVHNTQQHAPVYDCDYPKWRNILDMQSKEQSTTGNYNPRYLSDAAKACEIIAGKDAKNTPLNITLRGNYPATLTAKADGLHIELLLMPVSVR